MDTSFVDVWSAVHFLWGVCFFAVVHAGFFETAAVAVVWEIVENSTHGPSLWEALGVSDYTGDTLRNSATDIVFTVGGWCLAHGRRR